MTDTAQLTTPDLIELIEADRCASERELVLLDRLRAALDEVEQLTRDLTEAQRRGDDT